MEGINLKQVAEQIAQKIEVDKIYCVNYNSPVNEIFSLLILVPSSCGVKFSELRPFINMVIDTHYDVVFEIYQTGEVTSGLKNGNLLFHLTCIKQNLLYTNPNILDFTPPKSEDLRKWKDAALKRFNDGLDKTNSFLVGADFYNNKNDPNLTVFMLHQTTELTYRALVTALLLKEKKTHSIESLQNYLEPLLPQLRKIFPNDTVEEKDILKTLNNAYSSVRYEQNHFVNEKHIPELFRRVHELQNSANSIMNELESILNIRYEEAIENENNLIIDQFLLPVNEITVDSSIIKSSTTFFDGTSDFKTIVESIVDLLAPEQIYVFGNIVSHSSISNLFINTDNPETSKEHYDLLAISSHSNPYGINLHTVVNKYDGLEVNLLVHTKEDVIKKIENGNRFFFTVLTQGKLIYSKLQVIEKADIPVLDYYQYSIEAKEHSKRRIKRAFAFLKAANAIEDEELDTAISLLSQALEQTCLAMVYTFLGYKPNIHNLPHLLRLCKIVWPDPDNFFPMSTSFDEQVLTTLSRSLSEVRFAVGKPVLQDYYDDIKPACVSFIAFGSTYCQNKIQKMENKQQISLADQPLQ